MTSVDEPTKQWCVATGITRLIGTGTAKPNFGQTAFYSYAGSIIRDAFKQILFTERINGRVGRSDVAAVMALWLGICPHWKNKRWPMEQDLKSILINAEPTMELSSSHSLSWENIRELIQYRGPGFRTIREFEHYSDDLVQQDGESSDDASSDDEGGASDNKNMTMPMAVAITMDQQNPTLDCVGTWHRFRRTGVTVLTSTVVGIIIAYLVFHVMMCRATEQE